MQTAAGDHGPHLRDELIGLLVSAARSSAGPCRPPDPDRGLDGLQGHTSSARGVTEELRGAGYLLVARHEFLPVQLFLVFSPR